MSQIGVRPSQPSQPQKTTQRRAGNSLLAAAILVAGIGGGLLAWHPWDKGTTVTVPTKDPQQVTTQRIGTVWQPGLSGPGLPVECVTNETGGISCLILPDPYAHIRKQDS
ncbi:hypothetical protein ACWZHB_02830 [Nocardia sp. FBN12]|uniref:hypothetical protein n=1 Tax=Nocardia sp. FBN12 TaxID=3419766 RepID=UPI003D061164